MVYASINKLHKKSNKRDNIVSPKCCGSCPLWHDSCRCSVSGRLTSKETKCSLNSYMKKQVFNNEEGSINYGYTN